MPSPLPAQAIPTAIIVAGFQSAKAKQARRDAALAAAAEEEEEAEQAAVGNYGGPAAARVGYEDPEGWAPRLSSEWQRRVHAFMEMHEREEGAPAAGPSFALRHEEQLSTLSLQSALRFRFRIRIWM